MSDDDGNRSWTLLTGHGHVLVEIARNPYARIRDISPVVGLTERTDLLTEMADADPPAEGPPGPALPAGPHVATEVARR
jgi:hypothetical protein